MNKKQRDNRANQLNPNNKAYYQSRQSNQKKKGAGQNVVHHHHHDSNNLGKPCKICGRRGKIRAGYYFAHCDYCGGSWDIR